MTGLKTHFLKRNLHTGETVKKTKEKLFTDEYETTAVNTETPTTTETTVEDENEKNKTKNSWWSNCRNTCSFSRRDLCGCAQCF